jgi:hypothetical protein
MRWAKLIHHSFSLCSHLDATLRLHGAEEDVPLCINGRIAADVEEIGSTFSSASPTLRRSALADPA